MHVATGPTVTITGTRIPTIRDATSCLPPKLRGRLYNYSRAGQAVVPDDFLSCSDHHFNQSIAHGGQRWRLNISLQPVMSDQVTQDQVQRILLLNPPTYLPVEYASSPDRPRSSTLIDLRAYDLAALPAIICVPIATLVDPVNRQLRRCLASQDFPWRLFDDDADGNPGLIRQLAELATMKSTFINPSGETGLSHELLLGIFDKINLILMKMYPRGSRYWKVIGIGSASKTDWGFFVDGILRVIVELKPTEVSHPATYR